eukprot:GILI01034888.1.p1 GENE.GILI01034888.1~~GILI01034888.1.p1  ORF type:complete len:343 (+),score=110.19 GILI01034888.1:86-1114(+)
MSSDDENLSGSEFEGDEEELDLNEDDFDEDEDLEEEDGEDGNVEDQDDADEDEEEAVKKTKIRPLDNELSSGMLQEFQEEADRKGVVYISRVPPFMKVDKLRHLLSQFGEIGRIYLTPEDASAYKKRKQAGGNKKQKFIDGWVEFMDKRVAKTVALSLNGTPIGGKKRHNFFRDDMWTLRYLPKFKWHNLTERIAYENRVREQKLRTEVTRAKKENQFYLSKVEQAKQLEKMMERKKKRKLAQDSQEAADEVGPRVKRVFSQRAAIPDGTEQEAMSAPVLAKVFAAKGAAGTPKAPTSSSVTSSVSKKTPSKVTASSPAKSAPAPAPSKATPSSSKKPKKSK